VALAALLMLPAVGALAQAIGSETYSATSAVAVVVKVPTPWYAPKPLVWSRMRSTVAEYERIPGLSFKAYAIAQVDGRFGGLYLWKDLPSARAWFNPGWFERVEKERGARAQVQFYEVPVAIDNTPGGTPAQAEGPNVSTLVTIPLPAGVDKARLVQEFQAAIPTYRAVPGLMRKHFIITDNGQFGGIYRNERRQHSTGGPRVRAHYSLRLVQGFDGERFDAVEAKVRLPLNRLGKRQYFWRPVQKKVGQKK
jgi:hypothetical protein